MSDDDMEPFYSALLIREDPTGATAAVFEPLHEFSGEEADRYGSAYTTVDQILNVNVFTYVKAMLGDLVRTIQQDMEELETGQHSPVSPDGIIKAGVRMRNSILSFCSSLHFHQEHNYKQIFIKFGEGSSEHKQMQKIFNRLFEKCPEYRLLYHLRHTMVHYAMDVVRISAGAALVDGEPKGWTDPKIDISAMIELNTELKEKYVEKLRALPEDPSIIGLVPAAIKALVEANEKVIRILHPEVDAACATVREFDRLFGDRTGVRALSTGRTTAPPPPLQFAYAPWASNVLQYAKQQP
ncbi:hypothetical protein [Nocardia vaccinii]|uniref:hypothetical protein n=1 Tax=Nocardia vaccinii TaxID=1822 RepID=UPI000830CDCD|nr:hypothetical protein [Nocardia vaccinii]